MTRQRSHHHWSSTVQATTAQQRVRYAAQERGAVFVLTIASLVVLTSLVLMLSRTTRTQAAASANYLAQLQADAAARCDIEYLRSAVNNSNGTLPPDTTLYAQAQRVGTGYFWLLKRTPASTAGAGNAYAFGLTDEAGKLNINSASAVMLGTLPNMTQQIGANITAWRSQSATGGGAGSEYYQALPTPYRAKGAPFESVEELLMVKDVTVSLLYGNDTNRNGVVDASDQDPSTIAGATAGAPSRGAPGQRVVGLSDFVTVYSNERGTGGRSDVNAPTRDALRQALTRAGLSDELSQQVSGRVFVRGERVLGPFRSVLDFYFQSGLQTAQFRPMADRLTANFGPGGATRVGLVNLSTAPVEVIACLPGLTQSDAQAIVAARPSQGGFTSLADLVPLLNATKARSMGGMITIKSYQCSADVVACDSTGRAFKRYAVVIDASVSPPRVLHLRDLTTLGWPLDPSILNDLRAGSSIVSGMGTSSSTYGALGAR